MGANAFDLIIIVLLAWSAYRGFTKGLISSAASLIALLLGIWGAIKFSGIASVYLSTVLHISEKAMGILAFAITFILIVIAIHFIAKAIETLAEAVALGAVNKVFGAAFGVLKFAFIISVVLVILNTVNKSVELFSPEFKEKSLFYKPFSNFAPSVFNYLDFDNFQYSEEKEETVDV